MLVTTTTTKQNCALFFRLTSYQVHLIFSGWFFIYLFLFIFFLLLGIPREPTSGHELPGLGSELDQLPAWTNIKTVTLLRVHNPQKINKSSMTRSRLTWNFSFIEKKKMPKTVGSSEPTLIMNKYLFHVLLINNKTQPAQLTLKTINKTWTRILTSTLVCMRLYRDKKLVSYLKFI